MDVEIDLLRRTCAVAARALCVAWGCICWVYRVLIDTFIPFDVNGPQRLVHFSSLQGGSPAMKSTDRTIRRSAMMKRLGIMAICPSPPGRPARRFVSRPTLSPRRHACRTQAQTAGREDAAEQNTSPEQQQSPRSDRAEASWMSSRTIHAPQFVDEDTDDDNAGKPAVSEGARGVMAPRRRSGRRAWARPCTSSGSAQGRRNGFAMSVPLDWRGVRAGWQRAGNQTSLEDEEERGEEEEGEVSSRYRGPEASPPTPAEEYRSARSARLLSVQQQEWRLNSARVAQLKAAVQRRVEAAKAQLDVRLQQLRLQEEEELLQLDLRSHSHSAQLTQQQERQQQQRQMVLRSVELQLSSQEASLREVGQVSEAKYRETLERKQREEEEARQLKREKEEAQRRAEEELRAQQVAQAAREAEEKARQALQEQRQQQAAAAASPPAEPAGPPAARGGDTAGSGQPAADGGKTAGGLLQGEAGAWLMPKSAVAFEQRCAAALQQAQAAVQAVKADAQQQKAARDVSKQITKHINAISSTQRQVQAKAQELSALLHSTSSNPAQLQYAYTQLAARILSQAEMQIASNERSCYPIAEVVVAVIAGGHENLLFVLLGKLHQACPLAIPKFFKERTKLGFELRDEASGTYESEDSFVARLKGYMLLWGALTQAWLWLSRFVNHMPVNRFTGIALESFLRTSGYSFAHRFGKQARKLLEVMHNTFGKELQQLCKDKANADLLPIANRLDAFISKQEFLQPPAGHFDTLPVFDESANFG